MSSMPHTEGTKIPVQCFMRQEGGLNEGRRAERGRRSQSVGETDSTGRVLSE